MSKSKPKRPHRLVLPVKGNLTQVVSGLDSDPPAHVPFSCAALFFGYLFFIFYQIYFSPVWFNNTHYHHCVCFSGEFDHLVSHHSCCGSHHVSYFAHWSLLPWSCFHFLMLQLICSKFGAFNLCMPAWGGVLEKLFCICCKSFLKLFFLVVFWS